MGNLQNLNNDYARQLGWLFDEIPKTVLAAIAVSALTHGGNELDEAAKLVAHEWDVLHANGIVPQKPGKLAKAEIAKATGGANG